MVELTDNTNRADVFGFITPVSAFGAIIGLVPISVFRIAIRIFKTGCITRPLLGTLARPSDRFPATFSGGFWSQFPYFLPCLATSTFVSGAVLVTLVFFKEVKGTFSEIKQLLYLTIHLTDVINKKTYTSGISEFLAVTV